MPQQDPWIPVEPDWETILKKYPNPIQALAEMRTPAPVIRQAYNPAHCDGLSQRFIEKDLMYDQDTLFDILPALKAVDSFVLQARELCYQQG